MSLFCMVFFSSFLMENRVSAFTRVLTTHYSYAAEHKADCLVSCTTAQPSGRKSPAFQGQVKPGMRIPGKFYQLKDSSYLIHSFHFIWGQKAKKICNISFRIVVM